MVTGPEPDLAGRTAVLVDDGIATGGTAIAAVAWARARGATRVVLAVPVAPRETARELRDVFDDVDRRRWTPLPFFAVGSGTSGSTRCGTRRCAPRSPATG